MRRKRQQSVNRTTVAGNLTMIMNGEPAAAAPATELERAAERLRKDVLSGARHAVARLGLQRPALIEIPWQGSDRPVQSSRDVLGVAPNELKGTVTQAPELCRRLPLHHLVVLGNPGTGKSVVALHTVHEMAEKPQPGDPVPVLMPLSSWRPAMRMRDWIIRQVTQNSPALTDRRRFGEDAAAGLFDAGMVMPVLDGLDELPEPLQARAVEAVDADVPNGCWLLVTCRGTEYESVCRAGSRLTRAAVVELDTVEEKAAITYLRRSQVTGDDRWNSVFHALHSAPRSVLAQTMASPLMLYLAQTAYRAHRAEPGELSEKRSREEIEDTLLERYLPAVYTPYPPGRYEEAPARKYLTLIARHMRRDGTVDFAWWQLNARLTRPLVGLAFGLVWGWFLQALFGWALGLLTGLLAALGGWGAHALVRSDLKQVYVPEGAVHGPKALIHRYALLGGAAALAVAAVTGAATAWWLASALGAAGTAVWHYGSVVGIASGAATLLGSAWGSYQVSRSWFWLTGRLPWRLLPFLDDAHELGVLRQIGAVHQFRHTRLLRQLGGGVAEQAPRSVHGRWNAKWRRWKSLLPVFASLVQVGSALSCLALVSAMYALTTHVDLVYDSGDEPGYRNETAHCLPGAACVGVPVLSWKLPPASSRRTIWLPATVHGRSLQGWSGRIKAEGCAGGSVRVALSWGRETAVPFTLGTDADVPMPHFPKSVRPSRRPASLTLRRLDTRPCSLFVEWIGPGLDEDGLEPARKRLGVAAPDVAGRSGRPSTLT